MNNINNGIILKDHYVKEKIDTRNVKVIIALYAELVNLIDII